MYSIHTHTIQYDTIQYNTIQYNTIQYNTIQYNTIHAQLYRYGRCPTTTACTAPRWPAASTMKYDIYIYIYVTFIRKYTIIRPMYYINFS